ncbi:hypothetical protein Pan97_13450 [Bremerella volcania]|uniref:Uncharacterized protein n=1 Tax=Bremerella volcania TaxID=2527984 RepID=A0A518C536_9BACT|nr:hypothetical protein Pan97_13450 [Bremerella volcania]
MMRQDIISINPLLYNDLRKFQIVDFYPERVYTYGAGKGLTSQPLIPIANPT